jgi:2-oxoglutarate ferredoxin oxidoreductase subunit beta
MSKKVYNYIRKETFPTPFCPGCGHGIVMGLILRAINELDIDMDEFVFVSGSGCAGWIPNPHYAADTMHTSGGQSIPHAIGIKKANPNLRVVVIGGDGDIGSAGGNHLIHAAKRNLDITVICSNNQVLAQSGGQIAPTTPIGAITTTSRTGNVERPFDLCKIAHAAGAQYIARASAYHAKLSLKYIKYGLVAKGFSFIEVLSPCPVEYGRRNNFKDSVEMLRGLRINCVPGDIITGSEQRGITDRVFIGEFVRK